MCILKRVAIYVYYAQVLRAKHSENCEYTLIYLQLTLHTFNIRISEYVLCITHPGSVSINQNLSITHPGSVSINKKIEHNSFRTSEYK